MSRGTLVTVVVAGIVLLSGGPVNNGAWNDGRNDVPDVNYRLDQRRGRHSSHGLARCDSGQAQ